MRCRARYSKAPEVHVWTVSLITHSSNDMKTRCQSLELETPLEQAQGKNSCKKKISNKKVHIYNWYIVGSSWCRGSRKDCDFAPCISVQFCCCWIFTLRFILLNCKCKFKLQPESQCFLNSCTTEQYVTFTALSLTLAFLNSSNKTKALMVKGSHQGRASFSYTSPNKMCRPPPHLQAVIKPFIFQNES